MRKLPYFIFMLSATAIVVHDKKKKQLTPKITNDCQIVNRMVKLIDANGSRRLCLR